MKPGAIAHRKMLRLMRALDAPRYHAVGIVESLLIAVATQADDGDLSTWTEEDVAAAVDWRGAPSALVEALVAAGWLDRDGDRLVVHDWLNHAPNYVLDRLRKRRISDQFQEIPGDGRKMSALRSAPLRSAPLRSAPLRSAPGSSDPQDNVRGADVRRASSARPAATKESKQRKPVTEHKGLLGDLARAWSAVEADAERPNPVPEFGKAGIAALDLAKRHGEDEVRRRWGIYLACEDAFYNGHPLALFTSQWDRFIAPRVERRLPAAPRFDAVDYGADAP